MNWFLSVSWRKTIIISTVHCLIQAGIWYAAQTQLKRARQRDQVLRLDHDAFIRNTYLPAGRQMGHPTFEEERDAEIANLYTGPRTRHVVSSTDDGYIPF